jgi:hypothetical protein
LFGANLQKQKFIRLLGRKPDTGLFGIFPTGYPTWPDRFRTLRHPNPHFGTKYLELFLMIDSGLVGSTDISFITSQGHEPEHHAFSLGGKRQLARAHLPLDRRKWKIPLLIL